MADLAYKNQNFVFASKGIHSRFTDDQVPEGMWENLDNAEELAETSLGPRLGTSIVNRVGNAVNALSGLVHSVAKLTSLNGNAYRYAASGGNLYRRSGLTQGPYTLISSTLSGNPWQWQADQPSDVTAFPYAFFADANGMLKDNGSFAAPQQMAIFQPQYPVSAQVQNPQIIPVDQYTEPSTDYVYTGISGGTNTTHINTTALSDVIPGFGVMEVADATQIGLFEYLTIDTGANQETVLVINLLEGNVIEAIFTKAHFTGAPVVSDALSVTVPASSTATVALTFGSILPFLTPPSPDNYVGLYMYVSNQQNIVSITLKLDCGDGSFNSDYFYKVIAQGPLQNLLNTSSDPATSSTDAILSSALDIYGNEPGGIGALDTGLDIWTALLFQMSDFAGAGRADFNDALYNWSNINGYQVVIVTNDGGSVVVQLADFITFGSPGPDSLGGVAYDYLFTFYNNVDGTESNPCMSMTNVLPPFFTNWVVPRRQPVQLTLRWQTPVDPQITSLRIYRRGGTLGDNYRRIDEVLITSSPQLYTDMWTDLDIQENDFVSFTNDVPVTSALQVPVNTTGQCHSFLGKQSRLLLRRAWRAFQSGSRYLLGSSVDK